VHLLARQAAVNVEFPPVPGNLFDFMRIRPLLALPAIGLILLSSCRDPKIRNYRIAKETPPPTAPSGMPGMSGMTLPAGPASAVPTPGIHWQKPEGWQEQAGKSMRIGSFLIPGDEGRKAEVAITTFPGDVGGDFANVNRWRGQIQLPPITEAELSAAITSVDLPSGKFQLVDLTSTDPLLDGKYKARIYGAWLKQPERTWFFKLMGDADTVGAQHEALLTFLRSVEFTAPSAAAAEPASTNNLPAAQFTPAPVPPPPASESGLSWTAPADWTPKPLGQMRKGSFAVRGADGVEADLSITMLSAATNPLLENINRWRRQISLPPLTEPQIAAETTTLTNGELKFTLVDYTGTQPTGAATHLLGAILYRGAEAWFFKLTGPDSVVAGQKAAFSEFLKTVNAR
jgi:hypothetical protein